MNCVVFTKKIESYFAVRKLLWMLSEEVIDRGLKVNCVTLCWILVLGIISAICGALSSVFSRFFAGKFKLILSIRGKLVEASVQFIQNALNFKV